MDYESGHQGRHEHVTVLAKCEFDDAARSVEADRADGERPSDVEEKRYPEHVANDRLHSGTGQWYKQFKV